MGSQKLMLGRLQLAKVASTVLSRETVSQEHIIVDTIGESTSTHLFLTI